MKLDLKCSNCDKVLAKIKPAPNQTLVQLIKAYEDKLPMFCCPCGRLSVPGETHICRRRGFCHAVNAVLYGADGTIVIDDSWRELRRFCEGHNNDLIVTDVHRIGGHTNNYDNIIVEENATLNISSDVSKLYSTGNVVINGVVDIDLGADKVIEVDNNLTLGATGRINSKSKLVMVCHGVIDRQDGFYSDNSVEFVEEP